MRSNSPEQRAQAARLARKYRAQRKLDPEKLAKMRAQEKKYRKSSRDKINETRRKFYSTPEGKLLRRDRDRSFLLNHPDYLFNRNLVKNFGITAAQYVQMADAQKWVCAICGGPEKGRRKGQPVRLSVDHHHETGAVRALLCSHCNRGIGFFDGNAAKMMMAVRYLEKHGLFAKENRPGGETLINGGMSSVGSAAVHGKQGE